MEYYIHLAILVGIYLILAQSFNITFGLGRLFNLAHISMYAIGAYATALLSTEQGFEFFGCLLVSIAAGIAASALLIPIAKRLSDVSLGIGTLAFAALVSALLVNWKSFTHGVLGIPGIPRPEIGQALFEDNFAFLKLTAVVATISLAAMYGLFRNRFARSLRAMGEFEQSAAGLGIETGYLRAVSLMLASAFAAVAGCLFAYYLSYIDPSSFQMSEMIFVMTIAVVGRPGSFWGCIAATIFLVLLPEPLRFLDLPSSVLGPLRQLIYSVVLVLVIYINRARIFPPQRTI
jgi:branched-chain amino acid transport system permease protein